jgi:hypothetical protein
MQAQSHRHRSHCQNCGSPLSGEYCSKCGQHDVDYNRSFWHILEDSLEGVLHFDGKFFLSARCLFARPGFLTTEFIAGRRTRYTHPLRVYFFASFLLFTATYLAARRSGGGHGAPTPPAAAATTPAKAPENAPASGVHVAVKPLSKAEQDFFTNPVQVSLDSMDSARVGEFAAEFMHLLPTLLFFCVPLLALVLKLAYVRSGRLYVEHLIFAFHAQALAFLCYLVFGATSLVGILLGWNIGAACGGLFVVVLFVLTFLSFRRVYGQGFLKTLFKVLAVGAAYAAIVLVAFALMALGLGTMLAGS